MPKPHTKPATRRASRPSITTKKRSEARRVARKPEIFEIDGHELTTELHQRYLDALRTRPTAALALDETVSRFRPSMRAEQCLREIFRAMSNIGLGLGAAASYPFFPREGRVRQSGCDLLKSLEGEIYSALSKLIRLRSAIDVEGITRVQEWRSLDLDQPLDPETVLNLDLELRVRRTDARRRSEPKEARP